MYYLANFQQNQQNQNNGTLNTIDAAVYGAGAGFVAPGLISRTSPEFFENAIKQKNIFGRDIAEQLVKADEDYLIRKGRDNIQDLQVQGKKVSPNAINNLYKEAAEKAKGFVKKDYNPINQNLSVQTGLGRWGAAIGAGTALIGSQMYNNKNKIVKGKGQKK